MRGSNMFMLRYASFWFALAPYENNSFPLEPILLGISIASSTFSFVRDNVSKCDKCSIVSLGKYEVVPFAKFKNSEVLSIIII